MRTSPVADRLRVPHAVPATDGRVAPELVREIVAQARAEYATYDWDALAQAGFDKTGDYCFIYSYPPVRTLEPIGEDALFVPSEYGNLSEPCSLYVHIPYCTGICSYCYFAKVLDNARAAVQRSDYPAALRFELHRIVERAGVVPTINSVHFGGGTPSTLSAEELADIIGTIHELKAVDDLEITLECAPETLIAEPAKLAAMKRLGVNRLNLGVESLDDEVLRIMGRRHGSADTLRALELMFEAGFDNVNVDVIYDLPGQTLESWIETLCVLVDRGVQSISTYRLRKHPKKHISHLAADLYPAYETGLLMQLAHGIVMRRYGFIRSSSHKYARTKEKLQRQIELKRGVRENQLISIGCGAYGFVNGTFYWNTKSLAEYGAAVRAGKLPTWIGQVLSKDELMRKTMVTGMHTNPGIPVDGFIARYGEDPTAYFADVIERAGALGLLEVADGHVRPTERGRFFSDEISVAFYSAPVRAVLDGLGMTYGMFFENDKYA